MGMTLSHETAARYWMAYGSPRLRGAHASNDACARDDMPPTARDAAIARAAMPFVGKERVHFLVHGGACKRLLKGGVCHCATDAIALETAVDLDGWPQLSVVTPEVSFVQMSTELSRIDHIRYGSLLCGLFALDPFCKPGENRLVKRGPLTSIERMQGVIASLPHMKGKREAAANVRYLVERARSPMEIDAALHLGLPRPFGGSGLHAPQLNQRIALDTPVEVVDAFGRARTLASYECDLVWRMPGRTVIVEYQGEFEHSGEANIHRDSLKLNALAAQHVRVFTLTKAQFYDLTQYRHFADALRSALEIRDRTRLTDYDKRQRKLHQQLSRPLAF